jgi:ribosomal protein S18 acetylase RimI-like enzyme
MNGAPVAVAITRSLPQHDARCWRIANSLIISRARTCSNASEEVAAGLIGGIVEAQSSGSADTPAYVRPLVDLETSVPGSWLLLVIATYPEYRGKGFGAQLMEHARLCAIRDGASEMSLVTEDTNLGALSLYIRHGFHEAETRPWLAYDGLSGPTTWIRLVKKL